MSMDASSNRFAVAALMDNRMGMVCDIGGRSRQSSCTSSATELSSPGTTLGTPAGPSIFTGRDPHGSSQINARRRGSNRSGSSATAVPFNAISIQSPTEGFELRDTSNERSHERNIINRAWRTTLRGSRRVPSGHTSGPLYEKLEAEGGMPVETGPRSIYRHLCSDEDLPRSVAICPQRRCVAFGCSAGIELYWVDALTGTDLNRWFPLTAPSDFLYFLPPRHGVDNAKKLRLISSAAHPDERPAIRCRFHTTKPALSLFWGSFGFEAPRRQGSANSSPPPTALPTIPANCDHYRAIPLSDGYHILFTDPSSRNLYLGCDAPLGGPTKLLRKILLEPPEPDAVPSVYVAAAELAYGARIVAAYADRIVLYSIPPDVLALSKLEQQKKGADPTPEADRDYWANWWPECQLPKALHAAPKRPLWPLRIRGTEIGRMEGLVEFAVLTRPELTVWALVLDGRAKVWRVDNGRRLCVVRRKFVEMDGSVVEGPDVDLEGDVVMVDPHEADRETHTDRSVGLDGNTSTLMRRLSRLHELQAAERDKEEIEIVPRDKWYDDDGDVVMFDVDEGTPAWGEVAKDQSWC